MSLLAINWDVDPEIFRAGGFAVRWYGLLFASSFVAGYFVGLRIIRREGLKTEWLDRLAIYVGVGTILGARLGHCLFYEPEYYLSHPLDILKVWEGGLASHGAAVGILTALVLFQKGAGRSFLWILDRLVPLVALGGAFIRTGNLMNSEIYGHETDVAWAFRFLRDDPIPRHPTQIYEALFCLFLFGLLLYGYYKLNWGRKEGRIFGLFLILLFAFRFFVEFFKENQVEFENSMALNMGQILSIPFVLAGLVVVFRLDRLVFRGSSKSA